MVPLQPAKFLEKKGAGCPDGETLKEGEGGGVGRIDGLASAILNVAVECGNALRLPRGLMQVLKWQEENNVQEGDLLSLRNHSLPSNDN
ncbi:hypothetical protein C0993_007383 [Termitomyces sp. T159_Od127]|nr:hypothetical protein C0993_007383 [Termitomyces sp. T159_Od127]